MLWGENMANKKKKRKSVSKSSSKKNNKSKKVTKKTTPKKSITGKSPKKISKVSNIENGFKNNKVDNSKNIVDNEAPKEKNVKRKISIRKIVTLIVLICIFYRLLCIEFRF